MKKELLSPVGNFESLCMAVFHGCDAVYLGGKRFGARAFAANFSEEELRDAVFFCHLYGVRIYVTVNTMVYESELNAVLEYLGFLQNIHVDAVIMADIGLMKLTHEVYPDLEIHASTQAHTHNVEQVKILKELGVKRVVLARELSFEELQKFPDDLELEVFVHGALCISYSGQCLFSSLLLQRSGNRGECAQVCRLPFTLLEDGNHVETKGNFLLSTRDLNTASRMFELMNSRVTSFKIEGRMKSPAYVGFMTRFYRSLMDSYGNQKTVSIQEEDMEHMNSLFGRGFTEGCLFHKRDSDFMNPKTSNHQGSYLGKIEFLNSKKIGIRLASSLHQGDGIRFVSSGSGMTVNFLYNTKDMLVSSGCRGELVFVDNKLGIKDKGDVRKTVDSVLEKSILEVSEKKIPVVMQIVIQENLFSLVASDGEHTVNVQEEIVSLAKTEPITKESVTRQMRKLGGTPFVLQDIEITISGDVFVRVGDMNRIRRMAIEELINVRVKREDGRIGTEMTFSKDYDSHLEIYASAHTEEQLKVLFEQDIAGIYVSDEALYQKYRGRNVILRTNRVQHQVPSFDADEILAGESGAIEAFSGIKSVDYFFNVANHASSDVYVSRGAKRICLSPEMTDEELECLLQKYPNGNPFELLVYGRLEVMVLNHCIMRANIPSKGICKLCQEHRYSLQDRNGAVYPIVMDQNHRTHLFYHSVRDYIDKISYYKGKGIRKFRLEFLDEEAETIQKIVSKVKENISV